MQYEFNQTQTDNHIQIGKMLSKIQHNFIHIQQIHIKLHSLNYTKNQQKSNQVKGYVVVSNSDIRLTLGRCY